MRDKPQIAAATATWTRSSFCIDDACAEVALLDPEHVGFRNAQRPEQPHLTIGRDDWNAFLDEVGAGGYQDL